MSFKKGINMAKLDALLTDKPGFPLLAKHARACGCGLVQCTGNGSCLFNALSIAIYGNEKQAGNIRVKEVEVQREFEQLLFTVDPDFVAVVGTAEYQRNVKLLTNEWGQYITFGDDVDMKAISILFGCKIVCVSTTKQSDGLQIVHSFPPRHAAAVLAAEAEDWPTIRIAHHPSPTGQEDHFDLMLPHKQVTITEVANRSHYAEIWARALAA